MFKSYPKALICHCAAIMTVLLTPALHAESINNVIHWAGCGITKKAFMAELATAYETRTSIKVVLDGGGATKGIRDTVSLRIDMGGTCRMTLPEENSSEMHATLHPVAWDALAIITNETNPVNNLTEDQIRKIYTGKIKNWKDVGGPNAPIHLYVRKGSISGVGYAIRQYLFRDSSVQFDTEYVVASSTPLEKAIEKDRFAMGITGVSSARKRNVKILSFDGRVPSYENVRSGKYGLFRPLYLVTGPSPTKKVQDFIEFATNEEGQEIIRNNGTVPYADGLALMRKMLIYGFGVR
ncbi:MAG: phosphate ABC transporter substrate-binding protein [Gammaproteobacteria bacterium]|nr:phosphate ABC transporter substrate-binding protein [Gammaproteobacteria bacterium]MDH5802037.1 phosphate ABC transporter substrate-binding protein [Gammaproteobacteria bacterium]